MGRRLAGVVAAVLMANATLVSTAWACREAQGSASGASARQAGMDHDAGPLEHHHGQAPAPHRAPCSTPGSTDCCGAVAPCGMTLGGSATITFETPSSNVARMPLLQLDAPVSRVTSPDPPPPKL
jgi:hypothetical protein